MPPLSGSPSFITEPKTWDIDGLEYVALEITLQAGSVVIGQVTANAGTNLNTSLLALEAGNLALIKAKTDNLDAALSTLATQATLAAMGGLSDLFKTRQDTFTGTGNGTTVTVTTAPLSSFGIQVKGTGASATTWDIRLEGSLDGVNFSQILAHTNTTGDGAVLWAGGVFSPALYFRSRVSGLVLGGASNVVVTILGMR